MMLVIVELNKFIPTFQKFKPWCTSEEALPSANSSPIQPPLFVTSWRGATATTHFKVFSPFVDGPTSLFLELDSCHLILFFIPRVFVFLAAFKIILKKTKCSHHPTTRLCLPNQRRLKYFLLPAMRIRRRRFNKSWEMNSK